MVTWRLFAQTRATCMGILRKTIAALDDRQATLAYRSGHAWSQHAFHGEHVKSALMKQQNGRGHRV